MDVPEIDQPGDRSADVPVHFAVRTQEAVPRADHQSLMMPEASNAASMLQKEGQPKTAPRRRALPFRAPLQHPLRSQPGGAALRPGGDRPVARAHAEAVAARLKAMGQARYKRDGDLKTSGPGFGVTLHEDLLEAPLRWRRPRMVFVNSMSDLFHEEVPDDFIRRVFDVMRQADWHLFQVLTKRPRRMAALAPTLPWPPHVWAGTSVELDRYTWRANHCLRAVPVEPAFWPQRAAKKVVMSRARRSGSSLAAKCPPLSIGVH